ncbi:MAG: PhzF family phenazine biosynthesis protein [Bacteroidales bacterium]|jgi:PhzF family phenazine biosynthesis protein|nr:PhzF family phenazine biosynthesis protein [Bacteroidales bacterium]
METFKLYQVDAFSRGPFTGNPAAVCILHNNWLPDQTLQAIAMENNLSETAFLLHTGNQWHIRWFTPNVEVDLCGHATLASAHVLFKHEGFPEKQIIFQSKSGELYVTMNGDLLTLNFPADTVESCPVTPELEQCFNFQPVEVFKGKTDYMLIFENEDKITGIIPDFGKIEKLPMRGVIVTAPGKTVDFVSRFFGPQSGVPEDPVTGSAHTSLTPYWSRRLKKTEHTAMQLSARKGWLFCRDLCERIEISGKALTFFVGEVFIDQTS